MPLSLGDVGKKYLIKKITGNDTVRAHLRNMGIVENSYIQIVQSIAGNMILEVKGSRIALDASLVRRIIV